MTRTSKHLPEGCVSEPIFYVDKSDIRDGKLEELKAAIKELASFVEEHEPQLVSYGFYLDEAGRRMTVVAVHPDSASMEFHMKTAGPLFRKFADLIRLSSIEVYGPLDAGPLAQLRAKAQMLGSGTVTAQRLQAGFTRLSAAALR